MIDMPPPHDESIGTLLARLVEDARSFVRAEIALYRAQIFAWLGQAKVIAILAIVALVLVNCAAIALFVGLLLILQPIVGAAWATVIVVGGALIIVGLIGWSISNRVRKMLASRASI